MSRKIEDQMIAAIRAGKTWKSGNTEVVQHGHYAQVLLHGNEIAIIGHPTSGTRWPLAGWNTPTTRSRINALARAFNWTRVYCRKGQPWITNTNGDFVILSTEWVDALA